MKGPPGSKLINKMHDWNWCQRSIILWTRNKPCETVVTLQTHQMIKLFVFQQHLFRAAKMKFKKYEVWNVSGHVLAFDFFENPNLTPISCSFRYAVATSRLLNRDLVARHAFQRTDFLHSIEEPFPLWFWRRELFFSEGKKGGATIEVQRKPENFMGKRKWKIISNWTNFQAFLRVSKGNLLQIHS